MAMPTPALNVDHWALPIFDVEATYRFYKDVLELPLLASYSGDDWGGKPWLMMIFGAADGRQLALCALRGAKRPPVDGLPADVRHFAFAVASKRERTAWKQRLEKHGVTFSEEDHGAQQSLYFQDPNGIVLEITSPPSPGQYATAEPGAHDVVKQWLENDRGST
jgi:glyoxylase I family protein